MHRRLATAAAALLVVVSGLAAGCTDDSQDPDPAPSDAASALAELPELDPVWSADLGRAVEPLEPGVGADGIVVTIPPGMWHPGPAQRALRQSANTIGRFDSRGWFAAFGFSARARTGAIVTRVTAPSASTVSTPLVSSASKPCR